MERRRRRRRKNLRLGDIVLYCIEVKAKVGVGGHGSEGFILDFQRRMREQLRRCCHGASPQ